MKTVIEKPSQRFLDPYIIDYNKRDNFFKENSHLIKSYERLQDNKLKKLIKMFHVLPNKS